MKSLEIKQICCLSDENEDKAEAKKKREFDPKVLPPYSLCLLLHSV